MQPPSESTKLEYDGGFIEYVGSGKLKDKKVLITGGEYVSHADQFLFGHTVNNTTAPELVDQLPFSWRGKAPISPSFIYRKRKTMRKTQNE